MAFAGADLTSDGFLGGRLTVLQPKTGYRAGIDPVLLAAAVPARAGEAVLELGCGAGVASLCLAARVPDLALTGVELQPDYAELARRNAAANGIGMTVVVADIANLPPELRAQRFDHVIANPPYFCGGHRTAARDPGREAALGEATPLSAWIDTAARRLAPRGRLTMIQRADRLPDLIAGLNGQLGGVALRPIAPRAGRDATLAVVSAVKGSRAGFRLHAPLILHAGDRHTRDGEDYAPAVHAILRDGAAWPHLAD